MLPVAVVQLEHPGDGGRDLGDLDEGVALEPEAREHVVAIGIRPVVREDLVERERHGARDLVVVEGDLRPVALDGHARRRRDGAAEQRPPWRGDAARPQIPIRDVRRQRRASWGTWGRRRGDSKTDGRRGGSASLWAAPHAKSIRRLLPAPDMRLHDAKICASDHARLPAPGYERGQIGESPSSMAATTRGAACLPRVMLKTKRGRIHEDGQGPRELSNPARTRFPRAVPIRGGPTA